MTTLDDLRLSWTALSAGPGPDGDHFATLALPVEVAHGRVLLGRDLDGQRHLLIPLPEAGPTHEDTGSEAVQVRPVAIGDRTYTDVVCRAPDTVDIFDDLLLVMLREIEANPAEDESGTCIRVLSEWRSMLSPPRREPLSVNQTAGLIAELLTAVDILRRDPDRRLDVWTGPTGARHDFRRGDEALEVKASLAQGPPSAEIHGIEQLEPPEGGRLHLVWVRLERVPGGTLTVAGLVETLRRLLGGSPALYERLNEAGWRAETPAETLAFELRERRVHAVADPLPRLVPAMLPSGRVPPGVQDVRYRIALAGEGIQPLPEEHVAILLEAIATAQEGE